MNRAQYFIFEVVLMLVFFPTIGFSQKRQASLSIFDGLKAGSTTRDNVKDILGKPDKTYRSESSIQEWGFFDGEALRMTVSFNSKNGIMNSTQWFVFDKDPERDLNIAMKRYSSAQWHPDMDSWINPHSFPTECFASDENSGVVITYVISTQKTQTISRLDPARNIANQQEGKAPQACIGDKCVPFYSLKSFLAGTTMKEYCHLPTSN